MTGASLGARRNVPPLQLAFAGAGGWVVITRNATASAARSRRVYQAPSSYVSYEPGAPSPLLHYALLAKRS